MVKSRCGDIKKTLTRDLIESPGAEESKSLHLRYYEFVHVAASFLFSHYGFFLQLLSTIDHTLL